MIGLTADKLLLIAVLVAFLFGPERLPHLAERLGSAVHAFRGHLTSTQQRVREELGADIDVTDWKKLDPRQYDPRTIIRDALAGDPPAVTTTLNTDGESVAVLDDLPAEAEQGAMQSADVSSGRDPLAEPQAGPTFRRRSDGHLELVPASAAAGKPETEHEAPEVS